MPMVDGFNKVRKDNVIPGGYLVVDECMSAWEGKEHKYDPNGHPSVIKIARKPKGVGSEFKSLADGDSGVLLALDPREAKSIQNEKEFAPLGAGTAAPLRLMKNYFNSGRCLVGDSAFASLKASKHLRNKGIYFHGIVKTGHSGYPKKWCEEWLETTAQRGDWIGFEHEDPITKHKFYGCCWKDSKGKMIISNCSTLKEGEPAKKKRHRKVEVDGRKECRIFFKEVRRPQMVQDVFKCFSAIDVHDHYRQGSLKLEVSWKTTKWWHRVFCTLFGMTITDAFLASRYDYTNNIRASAPHIDFTTFLDKLCHLMINNLFLERETITSRSTSLSASTTTLESVSLFLFVIKNRF
jgi:hypothetical protein